jgi:hypothetical protein
LYVKAPLNNRYSNIGKYEKMFNVVSRDLKIQTFEELVAAVRD